MNTKTILLIIAAILGILGSAVIFIKPEIKQETTYDVAYYKANREEMKSKIKECANNPGEKENSPNCKNAQAAEEEIVRHGLLGIKG